MTDSMLYTSRENPKGTEYWSVPPELTKLVVSGGHTYQIRALFAEEVASIGVYANGNLNTIVDTVLKASLMSINDVEVWDDKPVLTHLKTLSGAELQKLWNCTASFQDEVFQRYGGYVPAVSQA